MQQDLPLSPLSSTSGASSPPGEASFAKRQQSADLTGYVALVTGGRVRIGYEIVLLLLRAGAHVACGTPGRIMDLIDRKILPTAAVRCIVLDEADEMLSLGFKEQIYRALELLRALSALSGHLLDHTVLATT